MDPSGAELATSLESGYHCFRVRLPPQIPGVPSRLYLGEWLGKVSTFTQRSRAFAPDGPRPGQVTQVSKRGG
jgi:hypothetical protein